MPKFREGERLVGGGGGEFQFSLLVLIPADCCRSICCCSGSVKHGSEHLRLDNVHGSLVLMELCSVYLKKCKNHSSD